MQICSAAKAREMLHSRQTEFIGAHVPTLPVGRPALPADAQIGEPVIAPLLILQRGTFDAPFCAKCMSIGAEAAQIRPGPPTAERDKRKPGGTMCDSTGWKMPGDPPAPKLAS
jgi:hypothetical protein